MQVKAHFYKIHNRDNLQTATNGCKLHSRDDTLDYIQSSIKEGAMTPHSQVQILLEQFDMKTGNFIRDLVKQGLEIRKMLYGELNGDDRGPQNGCLVEPASNFNHILPYSLISERPGLCRTFSAAAHGGRKRQARTASELRKSLQQACRHCVEASHAAQGRINRPTPVFGRPPAAHRVRRPRRRHPAGPDCQAAVPGSGLAHEPGTDFRPGTQ